MNIPLKNIWIVDDNDIDSFILESLLNKQNVKAQVHRAHDGQEAMNWVQKGGLPFPELIFLDINMPVMDGFTFLKEWAIHGYHGKSNIVIVSSSFLSKDRHRAYLFLDVIDYLEKPLSPEKLDKLFVNQIWDTHSYANQPSTTSKSA